MHCVFHAHQLDAYQRFFTVQNNSLRRWYEEMARKDRSFQILAIHFLASHVLNMLASLVFLTCYGGVLSKMLDVLMAAFWFVLGLYGFWFVTRVRISQTFDPGRTCHALENAQTRSKV
jgi:hypothetical protein